MGRALLANDASTTLAAGINNSVTTLSVASGAGALFPNPTGGDYFYATLREGALVEIVKVTARSSDTFTITRAQDNTTAQTFTAAATVKLSLTAANLAEKAGLEANTYTGAQNTARATVASAATTADIWAAAGNQIDWTGTTTCTGFPAAPQAGAERVLILAGAAPFTAGANMLIDGVASGNTVTCAANDTVIVRAVSTTQFKLSRVKYDGTAQVGSAAGDHEVVVNTSNAAGSTNTKIGRFTTVQSSTGTAITYADSATLGGSFTVNETAKYAITHTMSGLSAGNYFGVSVNSAQLTTAIQSINAANRLLLSQQKTSTYAESQSGVFLLTAGDVIRVHLDGGAPSDSLGVFRIRKVGS